jgi:hypothetical protein
MRHTLRSALGAGGVALALVAAGCGSGGAQAGKSPSAELDAAITNLSHSPAVTATLRLNVTAAQLEAIGSSTGSPIPAAAAQLMAGADITVAEQSANGAALSSACGLGQTNAEVSVQLAGANLIDLRTVGKTLYARADVHRLLAITHTSASALTRAQGQLPAGLSFVHVVLAGRWVSLDLAQVQGLAGGLAGSTNMANTGCRESKALYSALLHAVTVTQMKTGNELLLTTSSRRLVRAIGSALATLPGGSALSGRLGRASSLPNRTIQLQATVSDDTLSVLSVDLAQFGPAADRAKLNGQKLPLVLTFTTTAPTIAAPSGATPVNLGALLSLLGSRLGGSASASSSAALSG